MFVNDAMVLVLHPAVAALNANAGISKVLFGNNDAQPFSQIFEFLE